MKLKARAKINLTLDVIGKRENGYHDLEMIMQTINLYDIIKITPHPKNMIKLGSNALWLPISRKNIAYRAAELFFEESSIQSGVSIEIIKQIPAEAGLAGGSTDAAAVLIGLNHLFKTHYTTEKLKELGLLLGADVPFCIEGGTMLATGIGERLTPLTPMPRTFVVLVKPPFGASTTSIYRALDLSCIQTHPNTNAVIEALQKGQVKQMTPHMANVLEEVTIKQYPEIETIKQKFKRYGAMGTLMSGSGSVVFGLFEEAYQAKKAATYFKKTYQHVYITTTYNKGRF